jgi:lipopolysaccharide/colanic/teichoic acid biosynthesis glycosyltransferase
MAGKARLNGVGMTTMLTVRMLDPQAARHGLAVAAQMSHGYALKRPVDFVVGLLLALLTLPLVVVCAVVSAVHFRAWPFFTQVREGQHGELFRFVKIRSLSTKAPKYADREQLGDVEITRWGNFIRNRHIDELPQFWHVVGGSMSLVGPRPMIPGICERMDDEFRSIRQLARPGVTGLWQISEDGTRLVLEATHYDERYLEWASPRLDLWVIVKTVFQVLGARQLTEDEVLDRLDRHVPFGLIRRRTQVEFSELIDAKPVAPDRLRRSR